MAMLPEDGQIVDSTSLRLRICRFCVLGRADQNMNMSSTTVFFRLVHVFCTIYRPNRGKKSGSRGQFALASL